MAQISNNMASAELETHLSTYDKATSSEKWEAQVSHEEDASNTGQLNTALDRSEPRRNIETMALVVESPKADFRLVPVILDEVRADEVLVEMKYSGICKLSSSQPPSILPFRCFPSFSQLHCD